MKLRHLEMFIALAEQGSLRRAASVMDVSPPALAKGMSALEQSVGAPLFNRSTKGITLSQAGEVFLARARLACSEVSRGRQDIAELIGGSQQGTLIIGSSPTPSNALLPQVLSEFRKARPETKVSVVSGTYPHHVQSLASGNIDLAICQLPRQPLGAHLKSRPLFYSRVLVACREGHPLQGATKLEQLCKGEWVTTGDAQYGLGRTITEMFARHELDQPDVVAHCSEATLLTSLILNSDLLCTLPEAIICQPMSRSHIRAIEIDEEFPLFKISLLQRAGGPLTAAAQTFADIAVSVARSMPNPR